MSNEHDPKNAAKKPEADDVPLGVPEDAAELDLAGLSDSGIPMAELDAEEVVEFDLAGPELSDSEHTRGVSISDMPELASHLHFEEVTPVAEFAPASEVIPLEEPEAIDFEVPSAAAASSSNLFGMTVPSAEPVPESGVAIDMENLEPLTPLQPASGWFDSDETEPPAVVADAIDAHLAGDSSASRIEGSDIFSGGPIPTAHPKSDVSDVIAATAYSPAQPVSEKPSVRINSSRPSDVALTFDQPPGGSTVHDASADADLPVAAEYESSDSLFDGDEELDSARLAKTPNLPGDLARRDDADLGASPHGGVDASSILADLSEPGSFPGDSSAIRLEAPGMGATLRGDQHSPGFTDDPTEADMNLPEADALDPTDWRSQSGSDLFADRTKSEFELLPDAGAVDPFADDTNVDQPSLSSAPSSIFSGGKLPAGSGTGQSSGGSVPVANPDSTDSVEFSDHPDPNAADSGSFHVLPAGAGAVDFNMATEDLHPERSMRYEAPEDEQDDWMGTKTDPDAGPASGILGRRKKKIDPTDEMAPAPATPVKGKPAATPKKDPSMVMDWVADGDEVEATPESKSKPSEPKRSRREPSEATGGGKGRGLIGLALGLLIGVGGAAGAYFAGVVPNKEDKPNTGPVVNHGQPQTPPMTVADAHAAMNAGDPAKAVKVMETVGAKTAEDKAALGQAVMFARFRELAKTNAAATADDAELKLARTNFEAVMNDADAAKTPEGEKIAVKSALYLGLSYEVAGDRAAATKYYFLGKTKFPNSAEAFQTAIDRLNATNPDANKTSLRLTPADAEQLASAVVVLLAFEGQPAPAPVVEEPAEAGGNFWKAVNSAAGGEYDTAVKQIADAKKAHEKRAKALAGRGLNPLSDPLEQIFPRCCDDLKAYWELRKAIYEHPGVGAAIQKDGVTKTLDALAGAEKRAVDQAKLAADLKVEVKTEKENAAKFEKDLKAETEKVVAVEKDLKAEKENVVKIEKDLKAEKAKVVAVEKDLKAEKEAVVNAKKDVDAAKIDLTKAQEALTLEKADKVKFAEQAKARQATVDAIVKELQGAKLLPEKFDDAALLAATKATVTRATGPDLSKLIPPELSAVAGAGLTTGHLLDLAARVNKAEAASKVAATEVAKLKADQAAEVAKLTDSYKKTVADLKDAQALELKKAADAGVIATDKLKTEHATKLKEAADKYAADAKKLNEDNAAKVKSLEANVAAEKTRLDDAEKRFKAQLGDALSPSQQLDLWLAILVDLRRPTDADPALDAATRALKTAEAGSEEAAKAQTVAGIALLLKGDTDGAKVMFLRAKQTPAYVAAKGKGWAGALDLAFASVVDPTAIIRKPFVKSEPQKDPLAAARNLDAGIAAYKAGRYAAAEKALAEAAWHDPADAIAWYFLGATRFAQGKTDDAKADYKEGAEREQKRTIPVRQIDALISPIQGPARDALTAARP